MNYFINSKRSKLTAAMTVLVPLLITSHSAIAASSSGFIDVKLIIEPGCQISGSPTGNTQTVGTLDFGTWLVLPDPLGAPVTASLTGSSTAGGIQVQCNVATTYTLSMDNGQNADSGNKRMSDGGGNFIPYQVYKDAAHTDPWIPGSTQSNTTTSTTPTTFVHQFYGKVDALTAQATAGEYKDQLTVTIQW